jgi:type I restriction enzyme S subunit
MISNELSDNKYKKFMLNEWDIIISTSGTLGKYAIIREEHLPLCLNTSIIRFYPKERFENFSFMFGYLTSLEFYNHLMTKSCGSVQANFGPMHLKQINLIVPNSEILIKYHKIIFPLIKKSIKTRSENQKLISIRDTLLPKLMSGELRLK